MGNGVDLARGERATARGSMHYEDDARAASFRAFLERQRGADHVIALQDYPDPDAIGSALAYRLLAAPFDIHVDIVYEGRISHQENIALIQLLDLDLIRYTEGMPLDCYDGAVLIDNQGTTTRLLDRLIAAKVPIVAVVDHHAPQNLVEPEFSDIRPVGAAATIFTDYIRSGEILELEQTRAEHVKIATALMHALRSETIGFVRAGPEEYLAGSYLSRFQDPLLLEEILQVQRTSGTMDVIRIALSDRVTRGGYSFAGVGYVKHGDRDAIPQASDFLMTEEDVHTAIVYGILLGEGDREVVVGSVRTTRLTLDVDHFLKSALGSDARGRFYGGGRSRAGGFEIPVGFLEGTAEPEQLELKWAAFNQQIRAKLMRAAGVDEEDAQKA